MGIFKNYRKKLFGKHEKKGIDPICFGIKHTHMEFRAKIRTYCAYAERGTRHVWLCQPFMTNLNGQKELPHYFRMSKIINFPNQFLEI